MNRFEIPEEIPTVTSVSIVLVPLGDWRITPSDTYDPNKDTLVVSIRCL